MSIRVFILAHSGIWYLHKKGNLHHTFHQPKVVESSLLSETGISSYQLNHLQLIYENGMPRSSIADIMSQVVNKDGTPGEFIASTIKHIINKAQKAIHEIAGMSVGFSITKKTLLNLQQ